MAIVVVEDFTKNLRKAETDVFENLQVERFFLSPKKFKKKI